MFTSLVRLKVGHSFTKPEKIESRKTTLGAATKLYENRERVIKAFEEGAFPYRDGSRTEKESVKKIRRRVRRKST